MKKSIKDILVETVLYKIVHDYIYYDKDYIEVLHNNFTDEVISLFNKYVSFKEVYKATEDGLKLKDERGYF